jgi:localization factor PodJL
MKFGVPWRVKGIRPEARETAREAARRSGMPLGDWLNAVILRQAAPQDLHPQGDAYYGEDLASVHQRLDDLSRRVEQMTRSGPAAYAPRRARGAASPPLAPVTANVQSPSSLERAIAEISARQRTLNGEPAPARVQPQAPMAAAAPMPDAAPAPMRAPLPAQDISGLEEQLRRITDQIETLRKPGVEEAINALRGELVEIATALNEAMPRREIDAIEKQIAGLTQRIAEGRQAGGNNDALAGIEHGLAEVRDALNALTPAEQLVGFHEAIDTLAQKIDLIVAQKDPETMAQLENAINTLRSMSTHIASSDAVSSLASEVQLLGQKVDYIAHATTGGSALDNLEQRISAIADALAERAQGGNAVPPKLEALVQSLSDKIEQIQSSRSDDVAIGHLEDRIVNLVEKLDASESRLGQLEAIERGLGDLLVHIEDIRTNKQPGGLRADASQSVDELKHDIARTQDAVDSVHGILALVVDRLAKIEQDIRGGRAVAEETPPVPAVGKLAVRAVSDAPPSPPPRHEPQHLPKAASLPMPEPQPAPVPQAPMIPEAAPLQLEEAQIAVASHAPPPPPPQQQPAPEPPPPPRRRAANPQPIDPDLPPDQPLEPGSGPPKFSARIAASEAALGGVAPAPADPAGGKSSFIAAARRAAQAALQQGMGAPAPRGEMEEIAAREGHSLPSKLMKRMKSLFVAAGVVALVVSGAQIVGKLDFGGGRTKTGKLDSRTRVEVARSVPQAPLSISPDHPLTSIAPPLAAPATAPPVYNLGAADHKNPPLLNPPNLGPARAPAKGDITGSIPYSATPPAPSGQPHNRSDEQLPLAIGGAKLRKAAVAGDGAAEYEVAVRFTEGRGVPVNMKEAARWFERAASTGLVPAQFRYASMLEKGQGVKKDLGEARRLYLAAAARGNAKAMHNLAVLYAEGVEGRPDYATAVKWFRKAAQHGVSDSQYNLGVLCARGLGTEKDFAESYKWFALAGAKGDPESAKKRDEVAAQLDPEQLAKAEQAVKTFKAEPQPAAATIVPKPHGGWDSAATTPAPKPKPHPQQHRQHEPQGQRGPLSLGSFTVGNR